MGGAGSRTSKRYSSQRQRGGDLMGGGMQDERGGPSRGPLVQHVRPQAAPVTAQQQLHQQQSAAAVAVSNAQYYDGSTAVLTNFPPPPMLPYTLPPYLPRGLAQPPPVRLYPGPNPPPGLMGPQGAAMIQGGHYLPSPNQHYMSGPPPPHHPHQMMYTPTGHYTLSAPPDGSALASAGESLTLQMSTDHGLELHTPGSGSGAPPPSMYYATLPPQVVRTDRVGSMPPPPPGLHGTTYYNPSSSTSNSSPYPPSIPAAEPPQHARARSPPRRVKAAIPIVNPQDLPIDGGFGEGMMIQQPQGGGRQLRGTYTMEQIEPQTYTYVPQSTAPHQQQGQHGGAMNNQGRGPE